MGRRERGLAMLIANMAFLPPHLNMSQTPPDSKLATGRNT